MSDHLRVNPIRCTAHGLCAEILPERVTRDDWGYPIIDGHPITPELAALARRAVDACPVFALRVEHQRRRDRARSWMPSSVGGGDRRRGPRGRPASDESRAT